VAVVLLTPRRVSKLFNIAERYISRGRRVRRGIESVYPLFVSILRAVLRDVVDSIDRLTCPYCGASASTRTGILNHVRNIHHYELHTDIVRAIDAYARFTEMMVHTHSGWVVKGDGIYIAGSKTRIAQEIERDPAILEKLGIRC
jgi:hypothetical protein